MEWRWRGRFIILQEEIKRREEVEREAARMAGELRRAREELTRSG